MIFESRIDEDSVTSNTSNQKLIAASILALCAIAVIIGLVQLAKTPSGVKALNNQDPIEGVLLGGSGDRLAYITLDGMIIEDTEDGSLFAHESPAVKARKLLYFAAKDPSVKGILLRVNSPGGTVGMSQELYNAVMAAKKEKPVVVSMGDVAASGAYYTASAADKIVCDPGTLTASIGVILHSMDVKGLLTDKLGVKAVTIKSGKFKDILSPYRPATPEEVILLQNLINTSYHQFLRDVLVGRTANLKDAAAKDARAKSITAIADGRVVIGEEALKIGLVDALGGQEEAKKMLQTMAADRFHISSPDRLTLQEYETPFSIWEVLGLSSITQIHPQAADLSNPTAVLPMSMRLTNQPLWLMESIR
jgi:protease IV